MSLPPEDKKTPTTDGNPGGMAATEGVLSAEFDALAALKAALEGVEALNAVVKLMEQAAATIVAATDQVESKGDEVLKQIDILANTKKLEIDQHAATALERVTRAFNKLQELLDPFFALFRQGA